MKVEEGDPQEHLALRQLAETEHYRHSEAAMAEEDQPILRAFLGAHRLLVPAEHRCQSSVVTAKEAQEHH